MLGWPALPAVEKKPVVKWNASDYPSFTLADLQRGWSYALRKFGAIANIFVPTGKRSQLAVGDIDPRHGGRLEALWARGWPQETVIAQSGGGGWHVYCLCPDDGLPSIDAYDDGIELKSDGHIIIAPPSVHPDTGKPYQWLEGHAPWEIALAPLPAAVIANVLTHARSNLDLDYGPAPDDATAERGFDIGLPPSAIRRIALRRYHKALRKVREQGEGRNDTMYWLARQLQSLGFAKADVGLWVRAFAQEVWNG
jgi:hypothetical protein